MNSCIFECNLFYFKVRSAAMAEWLRRQTRNLLGFSRTGSNPVRSEFFEKLLKYNCRHLRNFIKT